MIKIFLKNKINIFIKKISKKNKIAIAFSGGIDSNILLSIYKKIIKKKILLIHINHNISNNSKIIERICSEIAKVNKTKILIKQIKIKKKKIKRYGLEAAARYYRYKKITEILKKRNIKYIIFGHTNDDLIETFFINLIRGTSVCGILSLKKVTKLNNIIFIRPLLNYNRNLILKKLNLKLIIAYDISNNCLKIKRNFIRIIINKLLLKKFNFFNLSINKFIKNINLISKFIKRLTNIDYKKTNMKLSKVLLLSDFRISNLLKYYFARKKFLIPSKNWIKEFIKQIKNSKKVLIKKKNFFFFIYKKKILIKKMNILVHKYGGTSLGKINRIKKVSEKIKKFVNNNYKLLVVVSAMSKYTDNLIKKYKKTNKNINSKFYDIIVSTGELVSLGLLCSCLQKINVRVNYLTSWQIPILTNGNYSNASILKINFEKILKNFVKNDVIVVPGFQGINEIGEITTLGRGGSDNTAIEFAYYLNAKKCFIYTDVKGIYNKDPKLSNNIKIIKKINSKEILEMSSLGSKVMQLNSMVNCINKKIKTSVLSSFEKFKSIKSENKKGTLIVHYNFMNKKNITSIVTSEEIMCTFLFNKKKKIIKLINYFNSNNLPIDNICFNYYKKTNFLSFSINKSYSKYIKILKQIYSKNIKIKNRMCKLTLIGIGIKNYSNNFVKILYSLKNNLHFYCFTTSEMKISFLFKENKKERILKIIENKLKI
ncbi:tRNA lysidine(34) synthetase TilS [Candidatus Vidania fulgoroideorum]